MKEDPITAEQLREYDTRGKIGIMKSTELSSTLREFNLSLPNRGPYHQHLPDNFPRAQLKMSSDIFAPEQ